MGKQSGRIPEASTGESIQGVVLNGPLLGTKHFGGLLVESSPGGLLVAHWWSPGCLRRCCGRLRGPRGRGHHGRWNVFVGSFGVV